MLQSVLQWLIKTPFHFFKRQAEISRPLRREFTTTERWRLPVERFLSWPMVVLLMIEGKCSPLRAKPAHFSGHLPAGS